MKMEKMRSVETIPGMRVRGIKQNDGGRTFVNVTMYHSTAIIQ
jgi:hypothetical protein